MSSVSIFHTITAVSKLDNIHSVFYIMNYELTKQLKVKLYLWLGFNFL